MNEAEVRDYTELIQALKNRMHELGVTMETLDDIAGLPTRYVSKIFAPRAMKTLGKISLGPLIGALGLKLIVAEDAQQLALVRSRLTKRRSAPCNTPSMTPSIEDFFRRIGALGGHARTLSISSYRRRQIARMAARARWNKVI